MNLEKIIVKIVAPQRCLIRRVLHRRTGKPPPETAHTPSGLSRFVGPRYEKVEKMGGRAHAQLRAVVL